MERAVLGVGAEPREYATERCLQRVGSAAALFAVVVPRGSRALRPIVARLPEPLNLFPLWLPRSRGAAAVLGAGSGYMEDESAKWAYETTRWKGFKQEVDLWTPRSLVPALLVFLNPLIAWKCVDGELKGAECAMAERAGLPLQVWPFFAVAAPEDTMLTRAWHRLSAGKYPVHRTQDFFGRRL